MKNIITLVVGDWSGDGHDKKDSIIIKSNFDKKDIEKAYKSGTKKLGFDFCQDVAADYEDNKLSNDKWVIIKKAGYLNAEGIVEDEEDEEEISLWIDSYTDIYLFIVRLGNSKFEFEYLTEDINPTINIGGYGLFN